METSGDPPIEHSLTVSAYARQRGVSHTAVQRAIADGRLVRAVERPDGKAPRILASIADVEWNERTNPAQSRGGRAPRSSHGVGDDYRRSLIIEKVVKTKLAQVRLDEHQGRLIDAAEAGQVQFEIARLVRNQIFELPDRLADELALEADAHRVRAILMREITDVMRKLSARLREGGATNASSGGSGAATEANRANGH